MVKGVKRMSEQSVKSTGKFTQNIMYRTASGLDASTTINCDSWEEFKEAAGELVAWLESIEVQPRPEKSWGSGGGKATSNVSQFPSQPAPSNGTAPACGECGAPIQSANFGGKYYSPEHLFQSRTKTYGKPLCGDCMKLPQYAAIKAAKDAKYGNR